MSQHTCVVNEIVRMDGKDVLDNQIIVVFRNGFSAMERMIVAILVTSYQPTVQFATPSQNSSVITIDVFPEDGCAISLMIGEKKFCLKLSKIY